MSKKTILPLLTLLISLLITITAWAAQPPEPLQSDPAWTVTYWNNTTLSGSAALTAQDPTLDHDWGNGSPAAGVNADQFSARWTRYVDLAAATYRFTVTSDDGIRLWVNNDLLVNEWNDHAVRTVVVDKTLTAGRHLFKVEFYENKGQAVAQLSWTTANPPPPTGTVIVDDMDAGFVLGGPATGWRRQTEGYNGDLCWTKNNDTWRPSFNWARWYPTLATGRYEVSVYVPERYTTTSQARYWIAHAEGYALRLVDQSANGGRWVSLGTYQFQGTREDYLSLADLTYEPYLTRLLAVDAAKWEPR
ncbi:MAG: PA14 domain-containing protein [Chloroflexota bacterium]